MSEFDRPQDELASKDTPVIPAIDLVERIPLDELTTRVENCRLQGMRFISTTCMDKGDHFEVYYHFDKDLTLSHLLIDVPKGGSVPSVSGLYYCAFLPENEMKDLFGIQVDGLNLDYGGKLLITDQFEYPPMLKSCEAPETKEKA